MKLDSVLKFFPLPDFLTQPAVGFDISDQGIKFIELLKTGDRYRLGRLGQVDLPAGTIEGGELKNVEGFKQILIDIKKRWQLDNVFISLPDDHAYTLNLVLPPMKREEILSSLELQIEEYIPLPTTDIVFDFDLVEPIDFSGQLEVGVSALPKSFVEGYQKVFDEAGLNLLAVETQGEALARTLTKREEKNNLVIVDLGRNHTAIFWVKNGVVIHASAAPVGGEAITRSLQKNLNIEFAEAEKMKMTQGLSRADEHKAIFESIVPVVSAVREELSRRLEFWLGQKEDGETKVIEKIILIGGQASLPGLIEYLSLNLSRPVEIGNPWFKIFPANKPVKELAYNEALRYGTALGLALRNFEK